LELKGGKEGPLVNSENLCKSRQRATVKFTGHNDAVYKAQPKVANQCGKQKQSRAHRRGRGGERK
ncbi:MAG TPA: hypothetical protein VIL21_08420, partial [Solirubrobacterales bacterium]